MLGDVHEASGSSSGAQRSANAAQTQGQKKSAAPKGKRKGKATSKKVLDQPAQKRRAPAARTTPSVASTARAEAAVLLPQDPLENPCGLRRSGRHHIPTTKLLSSGRTSSRTAQASASEFSRSERTTAHDVLRAVAGGT